MPRGGTRWRCVPPQRLSAAGLSNLSGFSARVRRVHGLRRPGHRHAKRWCTGTAGVDHRIPPMRADRYESSSRHRAAGSRWERRMIRLRVASAPPVSNVVAGVHAFGPSRSRGPGVVVLPSARREARGPATAAPWPPGSGMAHHPAAVDGRQAHHRSCISERLSLIHI